MKNIIITSILALVLFGSGAAAQSGHSDSSAYKPSVYAKDDTKKKKKGEVADVGAVPDLVNVNETFSIPISVFDRKGKFINGLTKDDVGIFVDGVEVPMHSFEKASEPPGVVLVLDTSPSAGSGFEGMQAQAWKLVQALPSNAKVMVIDFNSSMNVRSKLTADRDETQKAISKAKPGGGTSLYSAVRTIYREIFPKIPGRKVILIMTDGVDTTSATSTYGNSLLEVERSDVSIYPVYYDTYNFALKQSNRSQRLPIFNLPLPATPGGTSAEYKKGHTYLTEVADASGGRMFSSEKVAAATTSLVEELSSKYYATITVPKTGTGRRQVRVRVKRPGLAVLARGSFIDR